MCTCVLVGIATDGCGWLRFVIGWRDGVPVSVSDGDGGDIGREVEVPDRNRVALEMALAALKAQRMDYEPDLHKYEVLYGNWDIEEGAADRYAEFTEAIERIEKLLEE